MQPAFSQQANEPGTLSQPVAKALSDPPIEPVNRVSFAGPPPLSKTPSLERSPTHGLERDFEANGNQTTNLLACGTTLATSSYSLRKSPSSLDRPPTPWRLLCVVNIPLCLCVCYRYCGNNGWSAIGVRNYVFYLFFNLFFYFFVNYLFIAVFDVLGFKGWCIDFIIRFITIPSFNSRVNPLTSTRKKKLMCGNFNAKCERFLATKLYGVHARDFNSHSQ